MKLRHAFAAGYASAEKPFGLGTAQALMMLGHWHQQDSPLLRCRHGFRNVSKCGKCCGSHEHREVENI